MPSLESQTSLSHLEELRKNPVAWSAINEAGKLMRHFNLGKELMLDYAEAELLQLFLSYFWLKRQAPNSRVLQTVLQFFPGSAWAESRQAVERAQRQEALQLLFSHAEDFSQHDQYHTIQRLSHLLISAYYENEPADRDDVVNKTLKPFKDKRVRYKDTLVNPQLSSQN